MNENGWDNSRHISSATGVAYAELKSFLQSTSHTKYQPVTVLAATSRDIINGTFAITKSIIEAQNAYWFVKHTIQNLASFGCIIESFIPTYASGVIYISREKFIPQIVHWDGDDNSRLHVYSWYDKLQKCFLEKARLSVASKTGAEIFLESLQSCYLEHSYAYIYASPTSVYNITLLSITPPAAAAATNSQDDVNRSTSVPAAATAAITVKYHNTPQLIRFSYHLPPRPNYPTLLLTPLDYLLIIVTLGSVLVAVVVACCRLLNEVCACLWQ
jgi:hypothetical protein